MSISAGVVFENNAASLYKTTGNIELFGPKVDGSDDTVFTDLKTPMLNNDNLNTQRWLQASNAISKVDHTV